MPRHDGAPEKTHSVMRDSLLDGRRHVARAAFEQARRGPFRKAISQEIDLWR
jgi:hypothetical protein